MQLTLFDCYLNDSVNSEFLRGHLTDDFFTIKRRPHQTLQINTLERKSYDFDTQLRQVEKNLCVTDITKIKYTFNPEHTLKRKIEYAIRRIKQAYVTKTFFRDPHELLEKIKSECSDQHVRIDIVERITDENALELMRSLAGKEMTAQKPVEIQVYCDDEQPMIAYSFLDPVESTIKRIKKKYCGRIKGQSHKTTRLVVDLSYFIAELLFCKQLRQFVEQNKEECEDVFRTDYACIVEQNKIFGKKYSADKLNRALELSNYPMDNKSNEYISGLALKCFTPTSIYPKYEFYKNMDIKCDFIYFSEPFTRMYTMNPFWRGVALDIFQKNVESSEKISHFARTIKQTDYASYYQLKKAIPKKTVAAMENSALNQYFKDVEYDELTDLENVSLFENEVCNFIKMYFAKDAFKDWSFKIRRLGKYKSRGLVNPLERVICLDYRHPEAYVHEQMHCFDFNSNLLSYQESFLELANAYINDLDQYVRNLSADNDFKQGYHSTKKYNRSYYCSYEEIFANLGAYYFNSILGNTSLVKCAGEKFDAISEYTRSLVKDYYSGLFCN